MALPSGSRPMIIAIRFTDSLVRPRESDWCKYLHVSSTRHFICILMESLIYLLTSTLETLTYHSDLVVHLIVLLVVHRTLSVNSWGFFLQCRVLCLPIPSFDHTYALCIWRYHTREGGINLIMRWNPSQLSRLIHDISQIVYTLPLIVGYSAKLMW